MKLETFSPRDRPLFERYLRLGRHELSAYAFENIALWQPLYTILWSEVEGELCVFFQDSLGTFLYFPPLGDGQSLRALPRAYDALESMNRASCASRIEHVEEADRVRLERLGFVCTLTTHDYLCSRERLAGLKGNAYKSKRASVNAFVRKASPVFGALRQEDRRACLDLYDRWQAERLRVPRDALYTGMLSDSRRCLEGLFAALDDSAWTGRTVRAGGELKAFSLGYPISEYIFCIFYEVADLESRGCAQYVFQKFCADLQGYDTINIMDDCGLPNLARVKQSYRPLRAAPHYTARLPARREDWL